MNSKFLIFIIAFVPALFAVDAGVLEYDEISSLIKYYSANPLNINKATAYDIYELPYISEITSEMIFDRIENKGEIETLKTLVEENIIDKETASNIKACIKFKEARSDIHKGEFNSRFKRTLERSRAYRDSIYLGNRSMFSQKLSFYDPNISINLLMEKEPGEINYTDNMKANLVVRKNDDQRLIIGNFNITSLTGMLQKEGFTIDPYAYRSSSNFHDFTKTAPTANDYSGYNGVSGYYTYKKHRLSSFYGIKNLSSTINAEGEIETVNLAAYTRTVAETERRYNSRHEIKSAALEGSGLGIKYGVSLSQERFSRDLSVSSTLEEGIMGEISVSKTISRWSFRGDVASDFNEMNFKTNALLRTKTLNTDFYYGYIQKNKFSLTSASMMFGTTGGSEQVYGMRFLIKIKPELTFISDNLIYSTDYYGTGFPGAQFIFKSNIKADKLTVEPSFTYKFRESTTDNFVSTESKEYLSKVKSSFELKPFTVGFDVSYLEKSAAYGYLLNSDITYKAEIFKVKAGGDIYYTKNGAVLYSSIADIGRYPSMNSFSGMGRRSYIMLSVDYKNIEMSAGISRHTREDGETSGSGYDLIESGTVHDAEISFRYSF